MAAKKPAAKATKNPRRTHLLEMPEAMLARVEAYTDETAKADPYRPRNRNAALLALIDAGLEAKGVK
jgi:hypothetical protein